MKKAWRFETTLCYFVEKLAYQKRDVLLTRLRSYPLSSGRACERVEIYWATRTLSFTMKYLTTGNKWAYWDVKGLLWQVKIILKGLSEKSACQRVKQDFFLSTTYFSTILITIVLFFTLMSMNKLKHMESTSNLKIIWQLANLQNDQQD